MDCPHCKKKIIFGPGHDVKDFYEDVVELTNEEKLETENKQLKEFARYVIKTESWGIEIEVDGLDVQEMAEKLGLIKPTIVTEADLEDFPDFEVGDTLYRFTNILSKP